MEERPNYYAIIPANVRYSKITPNAKLLYGEITALSNQKGYCYATNNYFAELYGVSKKSISLWVKELIDNHFVESMIIYKDGTNQILNRYLKILPMEKKFPTPMEKNVNSPMEKNVIDNNINTNITSNNIIIEKKEKEKKENISSYNSEEFKEEEITIKEYKDYKKEDILERECIIDTYYKWREKQKYTFDIDKFADYYDGKIKKKDLFMTFRIWQSKVETQAEELETQYKKLMLGNIILNNKWEE